MPATKPPSTAQTGFRLLPWGYTEDRIYRSELKPSSNQLLTSLELLLSIIPEALLTRHELENISGNNPDSSGAGEILRIGYTNADGLTQTFLLRSRFARFEGSRSIIFGLERVGAEGITNPREILLLPNVNISQITFSLQWYERRWASIFGIIPVGTQTFSMRIEGSQINAKIQVQRQPSKGVASEVCERIERELVVPLVT